MRSAASYTSSKSTVPSGTTDAAGWRRGLRKTGRPPSSRSRVPPVTRSGPAGPSPTRCSTGGPSGRPDRGGRSEHGEALLADLDLAAVARVDVDQRVGLEVQPGLHPLLGDESDQLGQGVTGVGVR